MGRRSLYGRGGYAQKRYGRRKQIDSKGKSKIRRSDPDSGSGRKQYIGIYEEVLPEAESEPESRAETKPESHTEWIPADSANSVNLSLADRIPFNGWRTMSQQ